MKTISLEGACDLHIHSAPDTVDRIGNDTEIAIRAREAGMRAIVYKSVLEPTVSRAWHVMQQVEGIQVFGGVVLDYHLGGLNPMAVSPAIEMGAKVVWLPTYHALGHEIAFGALGSFGYTKENSRSRTLEPITILDEDDKIKSSVREIMEMCKDADIILAPGEGGEGDRIPETGGGSSVFQGAGSGYCHGGGTGPLRRLHGVLCQ